MPGDFPQTERTRLKRAHERGHYDRDTVFAVLDSGLLCHIGYTIEGQPFVTPTMHWREGDHIYIHGSSASRMVRHLQAGNPCCLTVSHLDGLVMARSAFHHSVNYRSVMVLGTMEKVTDDDHKTASLKAMMERVASGRWDDVRAPNPQEMKATSVLRMKIDEVSAKIRAGGPVDDEEDYALPCWAGVVPVAMTTDAPIADDRLAAATPAPGYLRKIKV
jgi:hypothetical protein